jgi:hypothetical protein
VPVPTARILGVGASSPYLAGSTAPTRVAVSPRFDFDPRTYAASGMAEAQAVCLPISTRAAAGMASFRVSKRLAHEGTTLILGSGTSPLGSGAPDDAPLHRQAPVRPANDCIRRAAGARRTGERGGGGNAVRGGGEEAHPLAASRRLASHRAAQGRASSLIDRG